jgi:hypothetical protein
MADRREPWLSNIAIGIGFVIGTVAALWLLGQAVDQLIQLGWLE